MLYVIAGVLVLIWVKLHAIRKELRRANETLWFVEDHRLARK